MPQQIQLRRGTAAQWTSANTLLAAGELGAETDTGRFKIGDGSTQWNSLLYATAIADTVTALATSGTVNIDCSLGDYFTLALAGNVTSITFTNLPGSGKGASKWIRITQDSTPRTVAWPASFKWAGGVAGAVSTGSGVIDHLAITTVNNGTAWNATLAKAFA
jgi:hypothetical protein